MSEINARFIEKYYQTLLHTPAVMNPAIGKPYNEYVSASTGELLGLTWDCTDLSEEGNTLSIPEGVDAEVLMKVLGNPEMTALLMSLAKTMK